MEENDQLFADPACLTNEIIADTKINHPEKVWQIVHHSAKDLP